MLSSLNVKNLVVVRAIEVDFKPGLTVLSGETGAGKSILIEALSLALGERAESRLVRPGAERAEVSASFELAEQSPALAFLREQELDAADECILRRVLSKDGRSRAFINGSPVPLTVVRSLGALLVDIHAQHAGQRLLQRDVQRELLDAFGGAAGDAKSDVAGAYKIWLEAQAALDDFNQQGADAARLELMRYQAQELHEAKLDQRELESIEDDYKKLANHQAHREQCELIRAALGDPDGGAQIALGSALGAVKSLQKTVPEAANLEAALEQASIAIDEALGELDGLESGLDIEPERLATLDRRLSELHQLARKHQVELSALAELEAKLDAELSSYDQREERLLALEATVEQALQHYLDAAKKLRKLRRTAARRMDKEITARLKALGMPHAKFAAELTALDDLPPTVHGLDRVEFRVSTNPEQPPGPVAKVASGGELSRITLAIQAATAEHSGVPVAIYDEVDTGIGGNTANIVGQNLRNVAEHTQVVCITHSPQVASAGDHHIRVEKHLNDGQSETILTALKSKARELEVARMLGAVDDTSAGVAHARELLTNAKR